MWKPVERTITELPRPAGDAAGAAETGRSDPFGAFSKGTHTDLQPSLVIFTGKHYSRTTDTAAQPRPTTGYKTAGKPTLEELQAQWGPFVANAGTYEGAGTTLTLYTVVAKDPRAQREKNFTRLTIKLDRNNLWLTPLENENGKIAAPVTDKYVRVE